MYQQYEPPQDLRHLVCFFYAMEHGSTDPALQPLLPSGTEIMGWQYAGKWRVRYVLGRKQYDYILPDYYTIGQQTFGYQLCATQPHTGIFGVTLYPGSLARLFKQTATNFTNNVVETTALFAKELMTATQEKFQVADTNEERMEALISFYRQISGIMDYQAGLVDEALKMIYATKGCITVHQLCDKLHIHERYLQRHFKATIGVTPRQYIQLIRFNNIFTVLSMEPDQRPLELVAMLYNYYDLSHFNKEYKRFMGVSPSTFVLDRFSLLKDLISDTPYLLEVQHQRMAK